MRMSGFLELRSMIGRHETEIAGLRQARLDTSFSTLSRGPAKSSRLPVSIYSGDRSTLPNFLDNAHGREKVNQSIAVWIALVKGIEQDKTLLDMIITAGSPSEAWKMLLSMVGDERGAATPMP